MCHVQRKSDGALAKNPPTDEIRDIMGGAWGEIEKAKAEGRWLPDLDPIWSLDNVSVHNSALEDWDAKANVSWRKDRGIQGCVYRPPPFSPDLHQVVEHAIAQMANAFKHKLMSSLLARSEPSSSRVAGFDALPSVESYFQEVCKCFQEANGGGAIAANCKSMRDMYDAVIACNGDYPPHHLM